MMHRDGATTSVPAFLPQKRAPRHVPPTRYIFENSHDPRDRM